MGHHRAVRWHDGAGRQVAFRLLHILEFPDGKISRENVWIDTAALAA
jgi:predicted ester cyclase